MNYTVTFTYKDEEFSFESDMDWCELWEYAEVGITELFSEAGQEDPEDFDFDYFAGPFTTKN